jgi:hypothetical protein
LDGSAADLDEWQREFAASHVVRWPNFLAPDLAALVRARLAVAPVRRRADGAREIEHVIDDDGLLGTLQMVLCDPALWRLVEVGNRVPSDLGVQRAGLSARAAS